MSKNICARLYPVSIRQANQRLFLVSFQPGKPLKQQFHSEMRLSREQYVDKIRLLSVTFQRAD